MKYTVFYSWQSDLPNNTNRGFLQDVIKTSIKDIHRDESIELEISYDRDTQGVPGSPNISQTILEKIKASDVFVADVSIVTGDKEKKLRLSPNPNVLLELGYAISCLGWDKIILLCNSLYGEDEDLPFDIRQHRRISYFLNVEDSKAIIRKDLAAQFKSRLIEILNNSRPSNMVKEPSISIKWVRCDAKDSGGAPEEHEVDILEVHQAKDIDAIKQKAILRMNAIDGIDGRLDRKWTDKVATFKSKCDEFIKQLETDHGKKKYLFSSNSKLVTYCHPMIENEGIAPASDIRVEFSIPEWLMVFDGWPDDIPKIPELPTPKARVGFNLGDLRGFDGGISMLNTPSIDLNRNRTSGSFIRKEKVIYWSDKLLHKHSLSDQSNILMLANPNSVPGIYTIKCNVFCVEYDDWRDVELKVKIMDSN